MRRLYSVILALILAFAAAAPSSGPAAADDGGDVIGLQAQTSFEDPASWFLSWSTAGMVALVLGYALVNAVTSAPQGSFMAEARKSLSGNRATGLYVAAKLGEQRAWLRELSRRKALLYTTAPVARGRTVALRIAGAKGTARTEALEGAVASCRRLRGAEPWYLVSVRLEPHGDREAQGLRAALQALGEHRAYAGA